MSASNKLAASTLLTPSTHAISGSSISKQMANHLSPNRLSPNDRPPLHQATRIWLVLLERAVTDQRCRAVDVMIGKQWLARCYQMSAPTPVEVEKAKQLEAANRYLRSDNDAQPDFSQEISSQAKIEAKQLTREFRDQASSCSLLLLAGVAAGSALAKGQICTDLCNAVIADFFAIWPTANQWYENLTGVSNEATDREMAALSGEEVTDLPVEKGLLGGTNRRVLTHKSVISSFNQFATNDVVEKDIAKEDPPLANHVQGVLTMAAVDGRDSQHDQKPVEQFRFYLARYYHYEQQLFQLLHRLSLATAAESSPLEQFSVGQSDDQQLETISQYLGQLFPSGTGVDLVARKKSDNDIDWQKVAAATACTQPLAIITGGPGTGKTTTVTKILLALTRLAKDKLTDKNTGNRQTESTVTYRIAMVAPTGKAAARLSESVQASKQRLRQELADQWSVQSSVNPSVKPLLKSSPQSTSNKQSSDADSADRQLGFDFSVSAEQEPSQNASHAMAQEFDQTIEQTIEQRIEQTIEQLWPWDDIPDQATTIHRLLGLRAGKFVFNQYQPLPHDCLVIDEASMIDLPLMVHLLSAVKPSTRVIMLGDPDQLSSVEAGSVLADLAAANTSMQSPRYQQFISAVMSNQMDTKCLPGLGIRQSLAILKKSHRFSGEGGIGQLASAVNVGDVKTALDQLQHSEDLRWLAISSTSIAESSASWLPQALVGYRSYWQFAQTFAHATAAELASNEDKTRINELFDEFGRYQILTATRENAAGMVTVNAAIEAALRYHRADDYANARCQQVVSSQQYRADWYCGRPVMISENDYRLGLFNGDIGIAVGSGSDLRVAFQSETGEIRLLLPSRLPKHDTAFAFTVHKSQGSEFDITHCVLGIGWQSVITRQLLYTAVTRARKAFWLSADQAVIEQAISRPVQRASGLTTLI